MAYVSVSTGVHKSLVFSVTGTQTLSLAQSFATAVATASKYENLTTSPGGMGGASGGVTEYLLLAPSTGGGTAVAATVPAGGGYVLDTWNGPSTIVGSGSGDTVMAGSDTKQAAIASQATYVDMGGTNEVIFINGNNTFDGGSGTDLIVTGAGNDMVYTGTGAETMVAGTGKSVAFLNDTASASSGYTDQAWLNDGKSTVVANGVTDAVIANAVGQQIWGNGAAGSLLTVVLGAQPGSGLDPTSATNDTVGLVGAANTYVWDYTSDNTVYGSSSGGQLLFVAGPAATATGVIATVVGGSGQNVVFGNNGSDITFYAGSGDTAGNILVAGNGNETLNGGTSQANQIFWGSSNADTSGTSIANDVLYGGHGNDTFVSGTGNETVNSGSGSNLFVINNDTAYTGHNNIVLSDFGSSQANLVEFSNYDQATLQQALDHAQTMTVNGTSEVILTLGNSTVTFVGVSSLNGHIS